QSPGSGSLAVLPPFMDNKYFDTKLPELALTDLSPVEENRGFDLATVSGFSNADEIDVSKFQLSQQAGDKSVSPLFSTAATKPSDFVHSQADNPQPVR